MYPALIINVMTWISENVIIAASQPARVRAAALQLDPFSLSLSLMVPPCVKSHVKSRTAQQQLCG
jgi:hypothetical protein